LLTNKNHQGLMTNANVRELLRDGTSDVGLMTDDCGLMTNDQ
jgi:hypothetical protein